MQTEVREGMLSVESKSLQLYIEFRKDFRPDQEIIRHNSLEQYQNMPVYQSCKAIHNNQ